MEHVHENDLVTFYDNGNNKIGQMFPEITINKKKLFQGRSYRSMTEHLPDVAFASA